MSRSLRSIILLAVAAATWQQSSATDSRNPQCSSAVEADGYIYMAAQSGSRPDGKVAQGFVEQATQALENLKAILDASRLTMDHVVYVQVYLRNVEDAGQLDPVFRKYFPADPPAGATIGVARLPVSSLQINAVAVRNLDGRKAILPANLKWYGPFSPGMLTHDRLFVSAMQGRDPVTGKLAEKPAAQTDLALDGLGAVAAAAGLTMKNFVFVNPYMTASLPSKIMNERYARRFEFGNTPARATIEVAALPGKASIEYTGVAVRDLNARRAVRPRNMPPSPTASPCVFAGDTLYCSAKSGFIPGPHGGVFGGTTAVQLRQTMRNQLDNLEEAGMNFNQVVSTTAYLDDLSDSEPFIKVYSEYFEGALPAQTLLQQLPAADRSPDSEGHLPDLEQMSLVATRTSKTPVDKFCK